MAAILLFLKLELYWLVLDALVFNEFLNLYQVIEVVTFSTGQHS